MTLSFPKPSHSSVASGLPGYHTQRVQITNLAGQLQLHPLFGTARAGRVARMLQKCHHTQKHLGLEVETVLLRRGLLAALMPRFILEFSIPLSVLDDFGVANDQTPSIPRRSGAECGQGPKAAESRVGTDTLQAGLCWPRGKEESCGFVCICSLLSSWEIEFSKRSRHPLGWSLAEAQGLGLPKGAGTAPFALCQEERKGTKAWGRRGEDPAAQPHLQLALTKHSRMRSAQPCPANVLPSTEGKEFPGIFLLENNRQGCSW